MRARDVKRLKRQGNSTWMRIVLSEGKNREIRRMLESLGHPVTKLMRVAFGPVELDRLQPGEWREISREELAL